MIKRDCSVVLASYSGISYFETAIVSNMNWGRKRHGYLDIHHNFQTAVFSTLNIILIKVSCSFDF